MNFNTNKIWNHVLLFCQHSRFCGCCRVSSVWHNTERHYWCEPLQWLWAVASVRQFVRPFRYRISLPYKQKWYWHRFFKYFIHELICIFICCCCCDFASFKILFIHWHLHLIKIVHLYMIYSGSCIYPQLYASPFISVAIYLCDHLYISCHTSCDYISLYQHGYLSMAMSDFVFACLEVQSCINFSC